MPENFSDKDDDMQGTQSAAMTEQKQAVRKAEKKSRDVQAVQVIHEAACAPWLAKTKASENKIWLEAEHKHKRKGTDVPNDEPSLKKQARDRSTSPAGIPKMPLTGKGQRKEKAPSRPHRNSGHALLTVQPSAPAHEKAQTTKRTCLVVANSKEGSDSDSESAYKSSRGSVSSDSAIEESSDNDDDLADEEVAVIINPKKQSSTKTKGAVQPETIRTRVRAISESSDEDEMVHGWESDHYEVGNASGQSEPPMSDPSSLTTSGTSSSNADADEADPAPRIKPKAVKSKVGITVANNELTSVASASSAQPTGGTNVDDTQPASRLKANSGKSKVGADVRSEESEAASVPKAKLAKSKSLSSTNRDLKFAEERPTIAPAPPKEPKAARKARPPETDDKPKLKKPKTKDDRDIICVNPEKWPEHIHLDKNEGLLKQTPYICTLAWKVISIVEKMLVTEQAWLELHVVADYRCKVLLKAAKSLEKTDEMYLDFQPVLKRDDAYCKVIGKWVVDRLAHACSPVRAAALDHIAVFQLGLDDMCRKRVDHLLAANTYVYPGHWEVDAKGQPIWVVQCKQIYLNKGLINILHTSFFGTPTAIGFRNKGYYVSLHPECREKELPILLVALAATGMHAALDAWKNGDHQKHKTDKFDGETYKSVYNRHVAYLTNLRLKSINAYHTIMSEIYSLVLGNMGVVGEGLKLGNALAVLDLSSFD